jgi:hypothetical protein
MRGLTSRIFYVLLRRRLRAIPRAHDQSPQFHE